MSDGKEFKSSTDEIPYEVLKTPNSLELSDIEQVSEFISADGYKFVHVYVPLNEIKRVSLPVDANPREPTRVQVVNKMYETIQIRPSQTKTHPKVDFDFGIWRGDSIFP